MQRHVVVFARQPRYGVGKRRLARAIGAGPAHGFYRRTLATVLRRLGYDPRWHLHVAWAPAPTRRAQRYTQSAQGRGDLGRRMARYLDRKGRLAPGPVVLVGSDIPDLDQHHVWRAFRTLGDQDYVFGPAVDGGFWLVGAARRRGAPREFFRAVRWSGKHALSDCLATVASRRVALLADRLADIDDGKDYAHWRAGKS